MMPFKRLRDAEDRAARNMLPNVGSALRLDDGRLAFVCHVGWYGRTGRVVFADGKQEAISWDNFGEVLTESPPGFEFTSLPVR
jgi:hypothetical protein